MSKYEKVFIIGNGFDISMGHRTKYSEFIESDYFDSLIANDNALACYLKEKFLNKDPKWIDIEMTLWEYIEDGKATDYERFKFEYKNLCETLRQYIYQFCALKIPNRSSWAYKFLEENIISGDDFIIIDFNYTPSSKKVLDTINTGSRDFSNRHINIHGSIIDGDDIIFGIHDGAGISEQKSLIKKGTKIKPKKAQIDIAAILKECSEIFIFGYSLGKTDEMYFKEAFNYYCKIGADKIIPLNLYHYGGDDLDAIKHRIDALTSGRSTDFQKKVRINPVNTKIPI